MTDRTEDRVKIAEVEALRRERDEALEARDDAIRERDEAHAGCSTMGQWLDVVLIQRRDVRAERDRYREALERIAAFHHAPGKTYKAAWVESVRMAREVLGMAQGAASSPDPMRDEPDSERDDAREEAREWARQFNRRRAREAVEAALPAGPVTADTEFVWIGGVPFVNATKHEAVVALRCAERDEARAEATRLRERELDDFTVTGDELDAALDRAEKAEQERDRYREALERIAEGESEHEWFFREDLRDVARAALGGGDD